MSTTDQPGDVYEDDEPMDRVRDIAARPPDAVSRPPAPEGIPPGMYRPDQGADAERIRLIERLTFHPGDALVVRSSVDLDDDDAERLTDALLAAFPGIHVVVVDELTTLETVDPERMERAGWVRAEEATAALAEVERLREEAEVLRQQILNQADQLADRTSS